MNTKLYITKSIANYEQARLASLRIGDHVGAAKYAAGLAEFMAKHNVRQNIPAKETN